VNEQELRAMVRDSIARQLGSPPSDPVRLKADATYGDVGGVGLQPDPIRHAAFIRLPLASGGDDDGACLIEPAVRCNHCGYCQSFGH
jgi:hypothetical protein